MNGKKAKRYRRQAEALTPGLPLVEYKPYAPPGYMITGPEHSRKVRKVYIGKPRVMSHRCTRKVYKTLKRGVVNG